jgi:thiol-disulfide isomerase/thioredoxin
VLLLAVIAAVVGPRRTAGQPSAGQPSADDGLAVYGRADYDWTIQPLDGEAVKLEAFRGRVLFINLWASWCTPCIREMETIERLKDRLADTDVEFLVVAAEAERPVRRHLRKYRYDLPIYLEVERIPPAFGLRGLPTSWLVDREGRIVLLRHGEAVWDTDEVAAFVRGVARSAERTEGR